MNRLVAIGADHAGYELKELIRDAIGGVDWIDCGCPGTESVDYPDYARAVAELVAAGEAERGVLICGTGVGMSITANKVPGIRAAACSVGFTARMCREHNDANVLCLGARVVGPGVALELVELFLATAFDGGERHARRVDKMMALDLRGAV